MNKANKIIQHRNAKLSNITAQYENTIRDYNTLFEDIAKSMIGGNKFITEFSYMTNSFVRKDGIQKCIGYADEEFTVKSLNNDSKNGLHLTHPDDIKHKIRYDMITYTLISSNYKFTPLEDHYRLTFRMIHKDGCILKVERSVYLFRLNDDQIPISQLSIWEVSRHPIQYVEAAYYTKNYDQLIKDFYELNASNIGLHFTPTEKKILTLKDAQHSNLQIQAIINIKSIRTVEKHVENIKSKCRQFVNQNNLPHPTRRSSDVLKLLRTHGLLPIYH